MSTKSIPKTAKGKPCKRCIRSLYANGHVGSSGNRRKKAGKPCFQHKKSVKKSNSPKKSPKNSHKITKVTKIPIKLHKITKNYCEITVF